MIPYPYNSARTFVNRIGVVPTPELGAPTLQYVSRRGSGRPGRGSSDNFSLFPPIQIFKFFGPYATQYPETAIRGEVRFPSRRRGGDPILTAVRKTRLDTMES